MLQHMRILAGTMIASTLTTCILMVATARLQGHSLQKRAIEDFQCKGDFDSAIYAKLDRICDDCYNVFREPALPSLCRKHCFTTEDFKGCTEVLLLDEGEMEEVKTGIKRIHGAEPNI